MQAIRSWEQRLGDDPSPVAYLLIGLANLHQDKSKADERRQAETL